MFLFFLLVSANQVVSDIFHRGQRLGNGAIEGPTRVLRRIEGPSTEVQDSESEDKSESEEDGR